MAEIERRLAGDQEKLKRFKAWQVSAQQRTILLEDHNHYIDQEGFSAIRVPCLAMGRGLVAQANIADVEDVFYLYKREIVAAAGDPGMRYQERVVERRAERERWLRVLPPASIGDEPGRVNPALESFFGAMETEPDGPNTVNGTAGSPGIVRGTARLVLTLDEIDKFEPGDILVTYATAPPWTPLFAVAGGIVTDAGGVLAHCAVVAREYGIPAVVGSRTATARIQDGMTITVDGTNGVVTIHE